MAVSPAIGFYQSTDGKTLTLIDKSVYTTPAITSYTRLVELWSGKDGTGTMLFSLPFVGSNLEVSQAITSDKYFSAVLKFTGSPTVSNTIINFTTQQFEINALFDLIAKNCGCVKAGTCDKKTQGFIDMYMSQVATEAGNSALANSSITSAYKYLTS